MGRASGLARPATGDVERRHSGCTPRPCGTPRGKVACEAIPPSSESKEQRGGWRSKAGSRPTSLPQTRAQRGNGKLAKAPKSCVRRVVCGPGGNMNGGGAGLNMVAGSAPSACGDAPPGANTVPPAAAGKFAGRRHKAARRVVERLGRAAQRQSASPSFLRRASRRGIVRRCFRL